MKNLLVVLLIFFSIHKTFSQERRVTFSTAISIHIKKYNKRINQAYRERDHERGKFLFDSLVNNHLKSTYFDNFKVKPLKGKATPIEEFEKPLFLITNSSWYAPGIGEISAYNDLADKFHDLIDFVVIYFDKKDVVKEKARDYNQHVQVVYVDELTNRDSHIINSYKHALGVPMIYLTNAEKRILDIRKQATHHSSETLSNSYSIYYNSFSKAVSLLVADLDSIKQNKDLIDIYQQKEVYDSDEEGN